MTGKREYTGGSVSYYKVDVGNPISGSTGYTAECNDIIEALGMNYAEGNAFKAIWRSCAARTLGICKAGYADGLYDAEKVQFFGGRMVAIAESAKQAATEASAEKLAADDGWIRWPGGTCPVESSVKVDVKTSRGSVHGCISAGLQYWGWDGAASDIIAYRIAKDQS